MLYEHSYPSYYEGVCSLNDTCVYPGNASTYPVIPYHKEKELVTEILLGLFDKIIVPTLSI